MNGANGVEVYSRILDPGCILGLPGTLCGESYNMSAVTTEPSEMAWIAPEQFQAFIRSRPELSISIVEIMSRELTEMNSHRGANFRGCRDCGCPLAETCSHHLYNP